MCGAAVSLEDFPDFDRAVNTRLQKAADELCAEFDGIFAAEQVRAVLTESTRELSGRNVAAFVPILAQRFARERLRARAHAEGLLERPGLVVLFVSLTGGGRAQIGAALLAHDTDPSISVHTAGSEASGDDVDANVRAAMDEIDVDLAEAFSKPLSPEVLADADIVVTMGRSVGEVEIPATARHVDWRVGDPAGAPLEEVRRVRDDIRRRVALLAAELESSSVTA
jgi:protein-tyrosine-phosphatase